MGCLNEKFYLITPNSEYGSAVAAYNRNSKELKAHFSELAASLYGIKISEFKDTGEYQFLNMPRADKEKMQEQICHFQLHRLPSLRHNSELHLQWQQHKENHSLPVIKPPSKTDYFYTDLGKVQMDYINIVDHLFTRAVSRFHIKTREPYAEISRETYMAARELYWDIFRFCSQNRETLKLLIANDPACKTDGWNRLPDNDLRERFRALLGSAA